MGCGVITPIYRWEQRVQNVRMLQVKELGEESWVEARRFGLQNLWYFFLFPLNLVILAEIEKKTKPICLFPGGAGSCCMNGPAQSWGTGLPASARALTMAGLLLWAWASTLVLVAVAMGFSVLSGSWFPRKHGDLPGPGIEPVSLPWQADSQPWHHQEVPDDILFVLSVSGTV